MLSKSFALFAAFILFAPTFAAPIDGSLVDVDVRKSNPDDELYSILIYFFVLVVSEIADDIDVNAITQRNNGGPQCEHLYS